MSSAPSSRKTFKISDSLNRQLNTYAQVASAAGVGVLGVGLLAATPSADAEVVFTPASTTFTSGSVFIDLNHDGINDFVLSIFNFAASDRRLDADAVGHQNGVLGYDLSSYGPQVLKAGYRVGPGGMFFPVGLAANVAATNGSVISGPFPNVGIRFLGLKFNIDGQAHYGWAALNVKARAHDHIPDLRVTLLGYAYETVADRGLRAGEGAPQFYESKADPQPGTLGVLALGAPALNLWRREDD